MSKNPIHLYRLEVADDVMTYVGDRLRLRCRFVAYFVQRHQNRPVARNWQLARCTSFNAVAIAKNKQRMTRAIFKIIKTIKIVNIIKYVSIIQRDNGIKSSQTPG